MFVAFDSALNPASGNQTHFFLKNMDVVPRKVVTLENPGEKFTEVPLGTYSRKTG